MVIMSRSQDKLQTVADEISELIGSRTSPPPTPSHAHHLLSAPEEKHGREVRIISVERDEGLGRGLGEGRGTG